jgi:hypothetical protein
MTEIRTVEAWTAEILEGHIKRAALALRQTADALEREAGRLDRVGSPGLRTYAVVASNVQHAVANALSNLQLDALTIDASEADAARVRSRVAEEIADGIETTIGGYPDNDAERPKVERGGHLNDVQWAAQIARGRKED